MSDESFSTEIVKELVTEIRRLDNEIQTLKETQKAVISDYKDRLDVKLFKAALRIAKIRSGVDSDGELDDMVTAIES